MLSLCDRSTIGDGVNKLAILLRNKAEINHRRERGSLVCI